ncbi:hypothetical protein VTO42DRAFT_8906 [Malbranchea cinnamomea]
MAPPPNTPNDKPLTLHARYQAPPPQDSSADPAVATAPRHHLFSHPIPSSLALNRRTSGGSDQSVAEAGPGTGAGTGVGTGPDTPTARTAYLSDLRKAVSALQNEINVYLTARMEEDAKVAQGKDGVGTRQRAQETKEEENYGEEVVDEDA